MCGFDRCGANAGFVLAASRCIFKTDSSTEFLHEAGTRHAAGRHRMFRSQRFCAALGTYSFFGAFGASTITRRNTSPVCPVLLYFFPAAGALRITAPCSPCRQADRRTCPESQLVTGRVKPCPVPFGRNPCHGRQPAQRNSTVSFSPYSSFSVCGRSLTEMSRPPRSRSARWSGLRDHSAHARRFSTMSIAA